MNGKAHIYIYTYIYISWCSKYSPKNQSILHFCVRFEFSPKFSIKAMENSEFGFSPPFRPSIELDLFETFLHHGGQGIGSFLGITQQHLRVLLDVFLFRCFLEPRKNKNMFFRSGDICCWLLAGLCFWRFKKGVKESKYNSPTDEFDLVIVEMLNDAANMLWR